jgi:hypothetical protein
MPNAAAAFEAKDIIKLMKLAGSSSGSWPARSRFFARRAACLARLGRAWWSRSGAGVFAGGGVSIRASVAAAFDSACCWASFSSGDSSRGVPSGLNGRRFDYFECRLFFSHGFRKNDAQVTC